MTASDQVSALFSQDTKQLQRTTSWGCAHSLQYTVPLIHTYVYVDTQQTFGTGREFCPVFTATALGLKRRPQFPPRDCQDFRR